jgi:2',3'-cyclic-nucleotide 2'-phosphodiesterase (5'-nucleotidase family)
MKKILNFILLLTLSYGFIYAQDGDIKEVTILHWNDFHARNTPYTISKKDSNGEKKNILVGGTSSLLGYVNKYRDNKSLLLNGGDEYQGSPISSITKGFSQVELLNLFKIDAFVIGNHDFDYGMYTLDSALRLANYKYLSANLYFKDKKKTFGKPYIIKEVNGVKIGIIGVSPIDLMTLTLPKNVSGIQILNTDSVITADAKELKKEKCDLIILLSHNGEDMDKKFAEKHSKEINIIIGGHSHTPIFKPEVIDGILVCQAGAYGRWLGKLDLKIDIKKDSIISYFGKLIETDFDSSIYDKAAEKKVENMLASIEPEMKRPIGKVLSDWKKNALGQWEADAVREIVNTDVSFINSGSIRKDMLAGNITIGDVWEINPFGNSMMKFSVSGKILKQMIANNIGNSSRDDNILFSGLYVEYDSKLKTENSDEFITIVKINGNVLDENSIYTVSTNNYVFSQLKKYFGNIPVEIEAEDTNILDRDLIIEAVEKQKEINPVFEKRIFDVSK